MKRRPFLTLCGGGLILLNGCTQPSGGEDGTATEEVPVSITSQGDQPAAAVAYEVEMVTAMATDDQPARLRVTITNTADRQIVVGEERDVLFHHVTSTDDTVYLHPAGEEAGDGPVEPGCWRLTDFVAVPEYYGTITLDAGESIQGEAYIYGHPDLPEGSCLPEGEHQLRTNGILGDDEESAGDDTKGTEFEWEFTIQIGG